MLPERALPGQFKLLLPSPMPPSPASLFTTLQQNQHKQNGYPCFCCPRWQTRIPFQTTLQSWLEHLILCEPASGLGSTCRAAAHAASTGNSCKIWRLIPIILQSPQPAEKHSMVATCLRIYKLAWGPTGSTEEPHKPFTWLMQSHAHTRAVPSLVSQQHVAPRYSGCKEASSCYCSVNIAEKGWTHTTDTQALSHTWHRCPCSSELSNDCEKCSHCYLCLLGFTHEYLGARPQTTAMGRYSRTQLFHGNIRLSSGVAHLKASWSPTEIWTSLPTLQQAPIRGLQQSRADKMWGRWRRTSLSHRNRWLKAFCNSGQK